MSTAKSVVIVGAGIAGLSAAALLSKQGYKVKLFERESRIGGRAFSYQHEGCTLDNGIQVVSFGFAGPLGKVLKATGADKYVPLGKDTDMPLFIMDKDYPFPRNPMELNQWKVLPVDARMDMADIALQSVTKSIDELRKFDETSIAEFVDKRYPNEQYHMILECLGRVVLHTYSEKVTSTYAFMHLYRQNLETSKVQAYPKLGVSSISSGLEKVIRENKGEILLNNEVKTVIVEKGKAKGVQLADGSTIESGAVVLDLPPKAIAKVLGKSSPKEVVESAKSLKPALDVMVILCMDKPIRKGSEALYTVPGTALYEIHEPTNVSPSLAPEGKHLAKISHVVASESEFEKAKDAILSDFQKKFPDIKVYWSKTSYYDKDNPSYTAGSFVGNQKYRLDSKCREIDGLYFVGDAVGDPGTGMSVAAASATALLKMLTTKS